MWYTDSRAKEIKVTFFPECLGFIFIKKYINMCKANVTNI
jgi:hypothetical protein